MRLYFLVTGSRHVILEWPYVLTLPYCPSRPIRNDTGCVIAGSAPNVKVID